MRKFFGIMLAIIGSIVAIINLIVKINGQASIIGGANGSTSIFIAGKIGGTTAVIGIFVGIILLIGGIIIIARKQK